MTSAADDPLEPLFDFAARWLGRELDQEERLRLARLASQMETAPGGATAQGASDLIEAERRRVRAAIAAMRGGVDRAARSSRQAQQDAEAAALKAVQASGTLDALRPSALRAAQSGETPREQLLIAQIADRLANLIRAEVDACFDRRFGPARHVPGGDERNEAPAANIPDHRDADGGGPADPT